MAAINRLAIGSLIGFGLRLLMQQRQAQEGRMALRLAAAILAAVTVTSCPAFACKGPTVLFADNFSKADPNWHGQITVSGGHANILAIPGDFGGAFYGGKFVDNGDVCVDMVGPTLPDSTKGIAGIMFGFTDVFNFYAFIIQESGQAAIIGIQDGGVLHPAGIRSAKLNGGPNVTNSLRVVWKGTSGTAYINDQPFAGFNIPQALQNSMIGLYVENDSSAPITYQYGNLKVTSVP